MRTLYRNHIKVEAKDLVEGDKVIIYENEADVLSGHSSLWLVEKNAAGQLTLRKIGGV